MSKRAIDPFHHPELIAGDVFLAENATVLGSVKIGSRSSVWFGAVLRGDTEQVEIGCNTNIQDLSILHSDPGFPCRIGEGVTVGHGAVVHGATIGDGALIGIRAVVLNGAVVGEGAMLGAGALVPEGKEIPAGHLAVGVPARVIRELTQDDHERLAKTSEHYVQASRAYREASS